MLESGALNLSYFVIATFLCVGALLGIAGGLAFTRKKNRREQAQVAARFEEASAIINSCNDAIVVLEDGKFTDCNPAALALFGCTREQLIGQSPLAFSPPVQAGSHPSEQAAQHYIALALEQAPQRFCWWHKRPNGDVFTVEVSLTPIMRGGRTVLAGVMRDVTAQQQAQRQMAEQKAQLELILASTAVGMWDWDIETGATVFNERWAGIVGYSLEELAPVSIDTWLNLCHPDDLPASHQALVAHWDGQTDYYEYESRMRHKNGQWVYVLDTGRVVQWCADGSPKRMVGTHLDVTARKQAAEKLQLAQAELQQFFDLSLDFLCIINIGGMFEKVNTAFSVKLGFSEDELRCKPIYEFMHPADINPTKAQLQSLASGSSVSGFKNRFCKQHGGYRTLNWSFVLAPVGNQVYAVAYDVTEQEETERELNLLSRIARETSNGVVIIDAKGNIEWINEGITRLTGYTLSDVSGYPATALWSYERTDAAIIAVINKGLEGKGFEVELVNNTKAGDEYWVDIRCTPLLDEQGNLQGFMAIQADITEQKRTALALKKQQQILEQMSEQANIGAWELDLVEQTVSWSDVTKRIHEVPDDYRPTLQEAISFYAEGKSREQISAAIAAAIEHGIPWELELQLVTAKGRTIWINATGSAEFEQGQCQRLMGSFQDIDERKRHQLIHHNALQHSQALASLTIHPELVAGNFNAAAPVIVQQAAAALQASRVSIWLFEDALEALVCSALYDADNQQFSAGDMLKRSELPKYFASLINSSIINACDAKTHPATREFANVYLTPLGVESMLDAVLSGGGSFIGVICIEQRNEPRQWSVSEEAFASALAILVSSVHDRQQKLRTQQQLITAVEAANAATQAKSDFLASMSHEIRTPMNGVMGMLGLVLKTSLTGDQERKLRIAQNSAQSLLAIINDILDFSKIDAGKLVLEATEFNLLVLFDDFAEAMAFRAEEHNLELLVDTSKIQQPHVIGDPGRLRQILTNLVGNALKFTHQGEVVIRAHLADTPTGQRQLVCSVSDTGIGIPLHKQRDLFDAFTQVDASNTRQYGGTGLGLSIVKKLCEVMDGKVSVASEVGKGSCFTFEVLLAPNNAPSLGLPSLDLSGKHVLVVDDNPTNCQIVQEQLAGWGITVHAVASASAAVALCDARFAELQGCAPVFDAALLDMQMPGINGATLGKTLKADPRFSAIPLVMMTSQAQRGDASFLGGLGFAGYFPKPVSPQLLHEALMVILDNTSLEGAKRLVTRHSLQHVERLTPSASQVSWPADVRILLVEDNRINQEVALDLIQDLGLSADVAGDGQEAVHSLAHAPAAHPYSLVLMDCQMPVMDGFAATRAIRQGGAGGVNRHIPIIAMTANAMKGDKERCLDAGMNDYLAKPVDADELQAMLSRWLVVSGGQMNTEHSKAAAHSHPEGTHKKSHLTAAAIAEAPVVAVPAIQENVATLAEAVEEVAVWDYDGVLKRVRGRPERLQHLVQSYTEQSPELITELYHHVERKAWPDATHAAHTLRGVAGNLGGTQLMAMAAALEEYCQNHNAAAQQLAGELLECNERLLAELHHYAQNGQPKNPLTASR